MRDLLSAAVERRLVAWPSALGRRTRVGLPCPGTGKANVPREPAAIGRRGDLVIPPFGPHRSSSSFGKPLSLA
jgi:hypothetical protein